MPEYRRRIAHYNQGDAHELTFSCYQQRPLLNSDSRRRILSRCIDRAVLLHGYGLIAFVYMPDHVHLLVAPKWDDAEIERLLYAIKRPYSARFRSLLEEHADPLLDTLMVRERPGKVTFRCWQKGPGYDRNLSDPRSVRTAVDYFHQNPVTAGLCTNPGEWKWSSWRYYAHPEDPLDPDLPAIAGFPDW